jgi:hypothetical protein
LIKMDLPDPSNPIYVIASAIVRIIFWIMHARR